MSAVSFRQSEETSGVGNSETFLTEACEYTNSFLSFFPKISIILNIDADHLDFFKDIDDIRHSFRRFAELLPADGALIINADTPKYEEIIKELPCKVITYSLEKEADYTADNITYDEFGHASFRVLHNGSPIGTCSLKVPGIHNVSNALGLPLPADSSLIFLMMLFLRDLRALPEQTEDSSTRDRSAESRSLMIMHIIQQKSRQLSTLQRIIHIKKSGVYSSRILIPVPRLSFLNLPEAPSLADHVVLADIYAARETDNLGISSADLQKLIADLGTPCEYFPTFDEIENFLLENCTQGDLLITMGAGDVVNIGEQLLGK